MQNIVDLIKNEVFNICEKCRIETDNDYWNHTKTVVSISEQLAIKFSADKEIAILGAYLHDISCPAQFGSLDEHHVYSAQLSEKILKKHNYPTERIERVKKCVLHHRGSKMFAKETIEEECVADADAISHFYNIPLLFRVAYGLKSLSEADGIEWIRRKLDNDFKKLSQRSKYLYEEKYQLLIQTLFDNPLGKATNEH